MALSRWQIRVWPVSYSRCTIQHSIDDTRPDDQSEKIILLSVFLMKAGAKLIAVFGFSLYFSKSKQ